MADLLGITRPAYTAYESGTRKPDYDALEKLADYFDVSTDYLLGRTDVLKENSLGYLAFSDGGENWTEDEIEYARETIRLLRKQQKKNKK